MSAGQYGPAASLAADRRPADPAAWAYLLRCAQSDQQNRGVSVSADVDPAD